MNLGLPVASIVTQKLETASQTIESPAAQVPNNDESQVEQQPSSTIRISSSRMYSKEEIAEQMTSQGNSMKTWLNDVTDTATRLFKAMDKLEEKVNSELPGLHTDDWEISINSENEIVVEGEDLSKVQINKIKKAAESLGIDSLSASFRDSVIKAMEQDRGPLMHTDYIGRYDLNRENFQDIVKLRELRSDTPEFINPKNNPNPRNVTFHGVSVANALVDQLESRSEAKYQWTNSVNEYI